MYHVTFNPEFFNDDQLCETWDCDLDLSNEDEAVTIQNTIESDENFPLTYVGESGAPRRYGVLRVGRFEDKHGEMTAALFHFDEV